MKSIFNKLSLEEIQELSTEINKAQAKKFGNPLSKHKQEKLMAEIFGFKNYNQLIGEKKVIKKIDKEEFQRTIIEYVVLSEGNYEFLNLKQLDYDVNFGDCVGYVRKNTSENIDREEMIKELSEAGSDPSFFQLDQIPTVIVEILDECFERVQDLIDVDDHIAPHLVEFLTKEYEGARASAITALNRANEDSDVSEHDQKIIDNESKIDEDTIKRYVQNWINDGY